MQTAGNCHDRYLCPQQINCKREREGEKKERKKAKKEEKGEGKGKSLSKVDVKNI